MVAVAGDPALGGQSYAVYLFLRLTYHSLISRPEVRSPKGSNSGTEAKFSQTMTPPGKFKCRLEICNNTLQTTE
ncbi:hypothetical protein DTO207G8_8135 [Paecilomyces variotii]|nr:hypothetical protein DTO207G8_8135 [Paecilomyces variotii]